MSNIWIVERMLLKSLLAMVAGGEAKSRIKHERTNANRVKCVVYAYLNSNI